MKSKLFPLFLGLFAGLMVAPSASAAELVVCTVQRFNCGGGEGSCKFVERNGGDGLGPSKQFVHARLPSLFPQDRTAGYVCKVTDGLQPASGTNGFDLFKLSFSDGESGSAGRNKAKVDFYFQFPDGRLEVITKKFTQLHPSATAPFAGISATPADFNTASLDVRKANLVKFIAYLDDDRVDILLGDFTIKSRAQGFYNLGVLDFARAECPQPPKPPKL